MTAVPRLFMGQQFLIPHPDLSIGTATEQQLSIWTDSHTLDSIAVSCEQMEEPSCLDIPYSDGAIVAAAENGFAIGTKG